MTYPFYPSLIPRYVDESWFAGDQPIDELAKLNELANQELFLREVEYRNVDIHTPHVEHIDDDGNDDEDDDMNEDDEEDDEGEMDDDMDEEEFVESPQQNPIV